jgi:hypothetical protein
VIINSLNSQDLKKEDIVFIGLDFTNARLIGTFNDKEKVHGVFIDKWNDYLIWEYRKDIAKILQIDSLKNDLSVEYRQAEKINIDTLFSYIENEFNDIIIENRIREFKPQIKDGIGLVIFIDKFNKTEEYASGWVTLYNLSDLRIIQKGYYVGKAGGIGMTNHWAAAIVDMLKKCRKDNFFNF